jgi:putative transposase
VRIKYDPADLSALYVFDPTSGGAWLLVPAVDTEYTHGLSLWKHRVIRSYVLRQKQEVDIYALAAAKQYIQEIAAREFAQTRKSRGRKTATRFLDIGTPPASTPVTPPIPPAASYAVSEATPAPLPSPKQDVASTSGAEQREESASDADNSPRSPAPPRRKPRRASRAALSVATPAEPDAFDTNGWGGDYNLPQHAVIRS